MSVSSHIAGGERPAPDPAPDYATALSKLAAVQAADGEDILPICRTRLLSHGGRVERAIVLIHGLTNCPAQYSALAPLLFERGYTVLVPRLPRHGLANQRGDALEHLTVEELRTFADTLVDIACGLAVSVTVAGISAGGVVAAWIAQTRAEADSVVLIAPAFGILPNRPGFGYLANRAVMHAVTWLPNQLSPASKTSADRPAHAYARVPTRGLSAVLRLGATVFDDARRRPPAAQRVLVITNESDPVVNNAMTAVLVSRWRARVGDAVTTYAFAREHAILHDLIDPLQRRQQTALVYPTLLDLIAPTAS